MLTTSVVAAALLLSGAWAQQTTASPTATRTTGDSETQTTTSSGTTTHTINVGAAGHKFTPDSLEANVGDIIEWRFYPSAHWVIRGDFDNPCIPYEYVGLNRVGFSSGEQTVEAIVDDGPRFRVRVNDTDPIWYYCGAPGSCNRWKMMGVVNPTKNETIDMYLDKAKNVDIQLRPGDPWPTESDFPVPTNAGNDATGHKPTQQPDSSNQHKSSGLSPGAIAGIVIGSVAVLIIAGAVIYLCGRRGGFDKAYRKSATGGGSTTNPFSAGPMSEGSNHGGMTEAWVNSKNNGTSVTSAPPLVQSPPMSPQPTSTIGGASSLKPVFGPDGTITSYYDANAGQQYARLSTQPSETMTPERHTPVPMSPPVELPSTFVELGDNRSLPSYASPTVGRKFSFPGGEEENMRPPPR